MKKVTRKNLPLVWLKLTAYIAEALQNDDAADPLCADVNAFLDSLAEQDAFGTEGQNDPRGDRDD